MGPLRPNRRLILAALVLAGAVLLVTSPVFVLAMAPAIALFALVAHRVMPGEDLIVRLRSAPRPRRRAPLATQRLYDALVPRRSGRLIASGLAVRPPPAAPLLTTS
ncbi:MAG: hypothetical protein ACAH82_06445 [Solirubrobacteraceae bacterium]